MHFRVSNWLIKKNLQNRNGSLCALNIKLTYCVSFFQNKSKFLTSGPASIWSNERMSKLKRSETIWKRIWWLEMGRNHSDDWPMSFAMYSQKLQFSLGVFSQKSICGKAKCNPSRKVEFQLLFDHQLGVLDGWGTSRSTSLRRS